MTASADSALYAFPSDLLARQREAAELYAELHAFQATLPWAREPHEGWPADPERKRSGRDATDGWEPEAAERYDTLLAKLRMATAAVQMHKWWDSVPAADMVKARMALKHAPGATLAAQDVAAAA
ncbi:hypothetical protein ACWC6I_42470 [Streptomyces sp. NPDC001414]